LRVWSRVELELGMTKTDPRKESYSLLNYKVTGEIKDKSERRQILDRCVLQSGTQDPIKYQNHEDRRSSICVVKPNHETLGFKMVRKTPRPDDDWVYTQDMSWSKPFLEWDSIQGSHHSSHIVAREAYEYLRKNPDKPANLFDRMGLGTPDWDYWLVLGNIKDQRTTWCVVWVHRQKKTTGLSTLLYCDPIHGKTEEWPYSAQADGNAPDAQMELALAGI